jgi:hypothetical protein
MVLLLGIPLRRAFGLEKMITLRHLDNAAKLMLATGLIVVYGYVVELFYAWYSGVEFEIFMAYNRVLGSDHWWAFWALILCNLVAIQPLWFRKVRQSPWRCSSSPSSSRSGCGWSASSSSSCR